MTRQMFLRGPALTASRVALFLAFAALIACADDEKVADDLNEPLSGSPTALASRDDDTELVELAISDGAFSEDRVELQEEKASVLRIDNQDDVAYVLRIGNLVTDTPIAPNGVTEVEFTTVTAESYEATLTPEGGGEPLDTLVVEIVAPGDT